MTLPYKIGYISGTVLRRMGVIAVLDHIFDLIAEILDTLGMLVKVVATVVMKLGAFGLALGATVVMGFAVVSLYQYFKPDFDRPITLNILCEGLLILFAGIVGIGLVSVAWAKAIEYEPKIE